MRILIINSKNSGRTAPFISDQVEALQKAGVICEYFNVEGKGVMGYLRNYRPMLHKIRAFRPDIIHAHYGLSGLLANLQRRVPVVTTYHGSDINNKKVLPFSKIAMQLSAWNIFVSKKNIAIAGIKKRFSLIPCGVDTELFRPMDKQAARQQLGFVVNEALVLFAGAFNNKVKNPALAIAAVETLPNVHLLELKGYSRQQVAVLMNAVDVCLMTSHTEGSPQFIKEAMACNCPIVSVNVGDVEEQIQGVENCVIAEKKSEDIAEKLQKLLKKNEKSNGSEFIINKELGSSSITTKLISLYQNLKNQGN